MPTWFGGIGEGVNGREFDPAPLTVWHAMCTIDLLVAMLVDLPRCCLATGSTVRGGTGKEGPGTSVLIIEDSGIVRNGIVRLANGGGSLPEYGQ